MTRFSEKCLFSICVCRRSLMPNMIKKILNGLYYLCKVSLYRFLWWWAPAAPMYVFSHLLLAAIEKKHGGLLKKVMALYLISFIDFLSSSLNQGKTRQMQIFRARFTYTRTLSGDIISDFAVTLFFILFPPSYATFFPQLCYLLYFRGKNSVTGGKTTKIE